MNATVAPSSPVYLASLRRGFQSPEGEKHRGRKLKNIQDLLLF